MACILPSIRLEPSEVVKTVVESGAELTLVIPDELPSTSSTSGGSGGTRRRKDAGLIWLTNHRFIFLIPPSSETISIPLHSILSTKFEQPTFFGNNYLVFNLNPAPGGGLSHGTQAELRFREQPMFDFVAKLEIARKMAIMDMLRRQQAREEEETLPVYTLPQHPSVIAGVPADDPPGYDA